MTNTLTWDIKPIALPKINTNLLSVISLILLLTMAFMTAFVIADDCESLLEALRERGEVLQNALWDYLKAEIKLAKALRTLNPVKIWKAGKALKEAADAVEDARRSYTATLYAYQEFCGDDGSGGCDSGSCG